MSPREQRQTPTLSLLYFCLWRPINCWCSSKNGIPTRCRTVPWHGWGSLICLGHPTIITTTWAHKIRRHGHTDPLFLSQTLSLRRSHRMNVNGDGSNQCDCEHRFSQQSKEESEILVIDTIQYSTGTCRKVNTQSATHNPTPYPTHAIQHTICHKCYACIPTCNPRRNLPQNLTCNPTACNPTREIQRTIQDAIGHTIIQHEIQHAINVVNGCMGS